MDKKAMQKIIGMAWYTHTQEHTGAFETCDDIDCMAAAAFEKVHFPMLYPGLENPYTDEAHALRSKIQDEVLRRVRKDGGLSVFWITETQSRGDAVDELKKRGVIARELDAPHAEYPWCAFSITEG